MRLNKFVFRNLLFFWRTNLAVIAGVAVAVAVLSGALLVGRSVRGSLRDLLYQRIGSTEYAITSDRFFGEPLAKSIAPAGAACPLIVLKGTVVREETGVRAHEINVYGVDERFWKFHGASAPADAGGRSASVGGPLARQLDIKPGDALLLRVETQQAIPREWLYGQRELVGRTIRLTCGEVRPPGSLGEFSLHPSQGNILSIFVPIERLQKDLEQPSRVNAVLLSSEAADGIEPIRARLKKAAALSDLGLSLKEFPSGRGFSLQSSRIILEDPVARAAANAATAAGMESSPVYAYLANSIRANGREIPYSVIAAADLGKGALTSVSVIRPARQSSPPPAPAESIWLTDWAAAHLGASPGDPVEIDYYLWLEAGKLVTRTARFRLAGVVATAGDVDSALAPEIHGITDAGSISSWDPPFPLDLGRIRPEDEDFWNRRKATPKAFITLARGRQLWENRFGTLTGLRIALPGGLDPESARSRLTRAILDRLDPLEAGIAVQSIRQPGLAASRGSTDFGEYFIYFSSFLIAAAILLSAQVFRLMVEQRSREIGTLRSAGFPLGTIRRIFLLEGIGLSLAGSALGVLGAIGYGGLMVFGLRTWWVDAVGTRRLNLHLSWTDLMAGAGAGVLISALAIVWTLRGLRRSSPRLLLAGALEPAALKSRRGRTLAISAAASLVLAALLLTASGLGKMPQLEGFFGSGFLLLASILCATALYLRAGSPGRVTGRGWPAMLRLALRNAAHRPGRSLVCASLIASAAFIIISMEAFRRDPSAISLERKSGTGGYPLVAKASLPILHDLNSPEGQEALGLSGLKGVDEVHFTSFRERPGDDASCLNLYAPREPKILGASRAFLSAGRFSFQNTLAPDAGQKQNPWLLLESPPRDAVIPAVADANTIQYILHLSVGSELTVRGRDGKPVRLRLVAALRDSIFQGELLISESNFLRAFPEHEGYRFFLLDAPHSAAAGLVQPLQEALSDQGFNVELSRDRLQAYHRVENAYLSTFQSLGTLGLLLGTLGLGAVLLRNVLERRKELALLRAVGYRKGILSAVILLENVLLIGWGLASGTVCAALAITPALQSRGAAFPFAVSGLILLGILAAGLLSSVLAVVAALRSPLLASLQSE